MNVWFQSAIRLYFVLFWHFERSYSMLCRFGASFGFGEKRKKMKTESACGLMHGESESCKSTATAIRFKYSELPAWRCIQTQIPNEHEKRWKTWIEFETRPKRTDAVAVCTMYVRACGLVRTHTHTRAFACLCMVSMCVRAWVNVWTRQRESECAYLIRSGRRSKTFGCGCFSVFNGDNTTVHANINSVDSSMGCEGVLSSGVWRSE